MIQDVLAEVLWSDE